ncbi:MULTISPECIES: OB-fold domain-containing protein [Microbacterium]|uniref:OB-fold domain-containing protein n=1 Tax=Microbacterium profundi TaxID=450380 RepID=A0ABV3LKA3_9MICO
MTERSDLDEGFRMLTRLTNVDLETLSIGARVRVAWNDQGAVSLPEFEPLG